MVVWKRNAWERTRGKEFAVTFWAQTFGEGAIFVLVNIVVMDESSRSLTFSSCFFNVRLAYHNFLWKSPLDIMTRFKSLM